MDNNPWMPNHLNSNMRHTTKCTKDMEAVVAEVQEDVGVGVAEAEAEATTMDTSNLRVSNNTGKLDTAITRQAIMVFMAIKNRWIQWNSLKTGITVGAVDTMCLIGTLVQHARNHDLAMWQRQRERIHAMDAWKQNTKHKCDG